MLASDEIADQKVIKAERGHIFLADFLQKAQKFRVLNVAVQRQPYGVSIRVGEVGQPFTLPNALAKDEVESLARPFDQAAFGEDLGNASIARVLLPQDVLGGNAGWKAARADDLDTLRILANEDGTAVPVIAVTHGIQDGLANHSLVECGYVPNKEALLEGLPVIALVDKLPHVVERGQEALPEFLPFSRRSRHVVRAVFEYELRLGEIFAQGFARAQQDQRRVCHLAIDQQLRIRKQLPYGANRDVLAR